MPENPENRDPEKDPRRPAPVLPGPVLLGEEPLRIEQLVAVARHNAPVELAAAARERIRASRAVIEGLAADSKPHYGVSTGFGALAKVSIPAAKRAQLQRGLVLSHAAGTGPEVERELVRALMLLRLNTLASGRTGVREEVAELSAGVLNAGITPIVHEYGSLGCSGDLSPLAHCAIVLIGAGEARDRAGERMPARRALERAGLDPVELREKEGLALINGTDGMLGSLALAIHDLERLLRVADIAAAASVEALLGSDAVFAADLHELRPHPGQLRSAANLRRILDGSTLLSNRAQAGFARVQDAYSLRCSPQVHGAVRDTIAHAAAVAGIELRSAIDNPVVTADGRVESNGNFHGAPLAYVLDFLAIAVADAASISERRCDRFLDVARSHGLPPFLAADPGVDSGLMIAQYSAAGIVSELKRLAVPSSVDSIPSSAMQEDHVSMGWAGARKLRRAIDGLARVLSIELLTAVRALDFRMRDAELAGRRPAAATRAVHELVRGHVPPPSSDEWLSPEIAAVHGLVERGELREAVEGVVGPLA